MLIYYAHPIDQARAVANGKTVRDIAQTIESVGCVTYRPGGAFTVSHAGLPDLERIDEINQLALYNSDALVAWLPGGVATLGVPAEIESALILNKPTLILTTSGVVAKSVQMMNWRKRGAFIETWTDSIARHWESKPASLLDILRTPPHIDPETDESTDLEVVLGPAANRPTRAYHDDAGLDLAISVETKLAPGEYKLIPTGIRAAVPSGWWGMITGRSSTWAKYRCDVRMAVIDAGYRGELMIGVENRSDQTYLFEKGMRLAQYVLLPTFPGEVREVAVLPEAHRGDNGYGSSGA